MKAVHLEITSFTGFSFDAEHYYGKLIWTEKKEMKKLDLKHPLSQKEATHLNKKDTAYKRMHRKGELSERFETRPELIRFAITEFKKNFKSNDILLHCDYASRSATPILCWPKSFEKQAKRINILAAEWEKIDGYEVRAGQIDDEWNDLLKKYFIRG